MQLRSRKTTDRRRIRLSSTTSTSRRAGGADSSSSQASDSWTRVGGRLVRHETPGAETQSMGLEETQQEEPALDWSQAMCTVIAVLAKKVVGTEDFEYKRLVQLGSVCSDLREAVDGVVFTDAAITRKCMTPPRPPRGSCDLTRRLTWADLTWESMNAPVLRRLFTVLQYLTKGDRAAAMNSLVLAQPVPTFFPTVLPNLQELHFGQGTIREHQMRVEKLILGLPAYAPQLRCLTMDRLDEAGQVPRALSELQHLEELRIGAYGASYTAKSTDAPLAWKSCCP